MLWKRFSQEGHEGREKISEKCEKSGVFRVFITVPRIAQRTRTCWEPSRRAGRDNIPGTTRYLVAYALDDSDFKERTDVYRARLFTFFVGRSVLVSKR